MRIDRVLSDMGIASRKESAAVARRGGVTVNGTVIKDSAKHIDPERDALCYLGRRIVWRPFTYVMLNKPEGYVSATEDRSLPCVVELLPDELRRLDLFPVGRLDRDTVGLMLLTNDGALGHDLLSPRHHVKKQYRFSCAEPLCPDAEQRFLDGIVLADAERCKSAELLADGDRMGGVITLTEGKYHQIKRMLGAIDNRIITLERIRFANLTLSEGMERGEWRHLTKEEIEMLLATQK